MREIARLFKERPGTGTGQRISALEGIGVDMRPAREAGREAGPDGKERERHENPALQRSRERGGRAESSAPYRKVGREAQQRKAPEPETPAKTKVREIQPGL